MGNEVSENIKESLKLYVEHRILPGSFLTAVLRNGLCEALGHADRYNRENLIHIVSYVYSNLPSGCWGSKEVVSDWVSGLTKEL